MAAIDQDPPIRPIHEIAVSLEALETELIPYGHYSGKIDARALLHRMSVEPDGRYVVVTGMTPTPLGEGKTLTSIGLSMALNRLGTRTVATLRQPSLGPVFGLKGGASGSGRAQIIPRETMNLHLTGDFHAITEAHNLLAAVLDSQLIQGNPAGLDPLAITWPRVLDLNDRALRHVVTGLGGRLNGHPRETRFDITATSELMAVLSLAWDLADLKRRIAAISVGSDRQGRLVTVGEVGVAGALTAVLREAINPNLLQTSEHTPVLVHGGPFANIAHGNSSVIADRVALKLADCAVTEAGFGADLGLEKMMHIKAPALGRPPDLAVLVCTIRALKFHSGHFPATAGRHLDARLSAENLEAVRAGAANLHRHIENIRAFGLPVVVAVNRFAGDTEAELDLARELALEAGAAAAEVSDAWSLGGAGAEALAQAVIATLQGDAGMPRPLVPPGTTIDDRIQAIATRIYRASAVEYAPRAARQLRELAEQGLDRLPVCMAKTHLSFSDDPKAIGAPSDFTLTVHELRPSTGAGYITALCGEIVTMPGLPRSAAVYGIDVDEAGRITGLV